MAWTVPVRLTLRYICPWPPAVPLSSTDWLSVDVAEAPRGRLLAVEPDPDVTLAWWKITDDIRTGVKRWTRQRMVQE